MSLDGTTPTTEDLILSIDQVTSEFQTLQIQTADTSSSKTRHSSAITYLHRPSKNKSSPVRATSSTSAEASRPPSSPLAKIYSDKCMQVLETHDNAVFLFADMQDFTVRAQQMSALDLTQLLNAVYSDFLAIVGRYGASSGIEIVKFAGDCIMLAASNADETIRTQQVKAMVNVGWQMAQHISHLNETRREDPINFRFGINMGPAAKVRTCFNNGRGNNIQSIDWIGEGVNKASRMESSSLPNQIQITTNVFKFVEEDFECSPCVHQVKSYDKPTTFFVTCPKIRASSSLQAAEPAREVLALTLDTPLKRRQSISWPSLSPSK